MTITYIRYYQPISGNPYGIDLKDDSMKQCLAEGPVGLIPTLGEDSKHLSLVAGDYLKKAKDAGLPVYEVISHNITSTSVATAEQIKPLFSALA